METRRTLSAVLAIALTAAVLCDADAQGLAPYFQSSGTEQKPRSNAGVALQGGDWLRVQADVALRGSPLAADAAQRASGSTEIVPNLRSALSLAKNLDIETRVSFAEWNAGSGATADTRLRYRKSLDAFIDSLEGSIWRSRDGLTKQVVRLGFNQLLGDASALTPLTLTGAAIFEATQSATEWSADARRVGFETRVAGLMPRFAAADQSLSFKVEKTVGTRRESTSTLSYDHAWTVSSLTNIGFKVEFPRRTYSPADDFEPLFGFDWRSRF
jgi:hypothetical protein